jgi:hypothetical protein
MENLKVLFNSIDVNNQLSLKKCPQEQVKKHLESGRSITVSQCYKMFYTHDLRKIISRLKQSGMAIEGTMYRDKFNTYKIYKLKQ